MWASIRAVAICTKQLKHLYPAGRNVKVTLCDLNAEDHFRQSVGFEQPTCLMCIARWTHPCDVDCAYEDGCDRCAGRRG